jgi:hypothetical protein
MLNWIIGTSGLRRLLLWLLWDSGIRLPGKVAPWLFGLAIGRKSHRIAKKSDVNIHLTRIPTGALNAEPNLTVID